MVSPSESSVGLVKFPFSDLSSSKLRPAVVLASVGRDDWILCQVTSNPYADPRAIQITDLGKTGTLHYEVMSDNRLYFFYCHTS